MADSERYDLSRDRRGMLWDLALYVPTVAVLFLIGARLWFGPNQTWSYLLFFMACFFLFAGANRILSSRLMVLPSAPQALEVGKDRISLELKSGERVELVKEVRFFPDYAGKSFGLSGMDLSGKRRQFVFHRGQFHDDSAYQGLRSALNVYK